MTTANYYQQRLAKTVEHFFYTGRIGRKFARLWRLLPSFFVSTEIFLTEKGKGKIAWEKIWVRDLKGALLKIVGQGGVPVAAGEVVGAAVEIVVERGGGEGWFLVEQVVYADGKAQAERQRVGELQVVG